MRLLEVLRQERVSLSGATKDPQLPFSPRTLNPTSLRQTFPWEEVCQEGQREEEGYVKIKRRNNG